MHRCLIVALLALGCAHQPPEEAVAPDLLYIRELHGQRDLFRYDFKSRRSKALTDDRFKEFSPLWDHQGQIVLAGDHEGQTQIFRLASAQTFSALTRTPAADNFQPALGVDGRICFTSNREGPRQIFALSPDGQHLRHVTPWAGEHRLPPLDDGRILYVSDKTGKREIWVVNGDGHAPKQLTKWEMDIQQIAVIPRAWEKRWMTTMLTGIMRPLVAEEPDVVVAARHPRGDLDLFRWNWHTGQVRNLTNRPGDDALPVLLPDGLIAYTHTEGTQSQIWLMDTYGRQDLPLRLGPGQAFTQ